MIAFLKKAADKIAGAVVGFIKGIGAGFEATHYHVIEKNIGSLDSLGFLFVAPALFGYYMGSGFIRGARQGYEVAKKYHQEVKSYYDNQINTEAVLNRVVQLNKYPPLFSLFLTENECNEFTKLVDKLPPEEKDKQNAQFDEYKDYIARTNCPLSGKNVKEMSKPMAVRCDNVDYVCEAKPLIQHLVNCYRLGHPARVGQSQTGNPIRFADVESLDITTLPINVYFFVGEVRDTLTSVNRMKRFFNVIASELIAPKLASLAPANDVINTDKSIKTVEKTPAVVNVELPLAAVMKTEANIELRRTFGK